MTRELGICLTVVKEVLKGQVALKSGDEVLSCDTVAYGKTRFGTLVDRRVLLYSPASSKRIGTYFSLLAANRERSRFTSGIVS